MNFNYNNIY